MSGREELIRGGRRDNGRFSEWWTWERASGGGVGVGLLKYCSVSAVVKRGHKYIKLSVVADRGVLHQFLEEVVRLQG